VAKAAAVAETILTRHEAETVEAGRALGASLHEGSTVLLYGPLGAGKTAFVRGLAAALGIDPGEVTSPTFTLIQEYRGRLTLYHVDLYRVSPQEADDLGLEELAGPEAIVAIEWAERMGRPAPSAVRVTIETSDDDTRRLTVDEA
jgi:tRNA threonylcarbamoyladenosine biosynthesis protein TsaE